MFIQSQRAKEMEDSLWKRFLIQITAAMLLIWLTVIALYTQEGIISHENDQVGGGFRMDAVRRASIPKYEVDAPFEDLWPENNLPLWATKTFNYDVPPNESICFVHVGKAGGSSVGCNLGFSLHCGDDATQLDGVLPEVTTHVFHKDVYNCRDDSAFFLFVIRNPLDRIRSAFYYNRPYLQDDENYDDDYMESKKGQRMQKFYVDCPFYTLEELAQNGLSEYGEASSYCKHIAKSSLEGISYYPSHFFYNYQYYLEAIPEHAPILVLRNEHLIDDWNALEESLGGVPNAMESIPRINANPVTKEDDLYLSDESRQLLCQALCNEIQEYRRIIYMARNLDGVQIQVSLEELKESCPEEAVVDRCPEDLPDITKKLISNRGYLKEEEEDDDVNDDDEDDSQ